MYKTNTFSCFLYDYFLSKFLLLYETFRNFATIKLIGRKTCQQFLKTEHETK